MKLVQKDYEENSIVSILSYIILYLIVYLYADDKAAHPALNPIYHIPYFSIIIFRIFLLIYSYKHVVNKFLSDFVLITTGSFWILFYAVEIYFGPAQNELLTLIPIWIIGITTAASMGLYKRAGLLTGFLTVMFVPSMTLTIINEIPFRFIFGMAFFIMYGYLMYYSRKNYLIYKELRNQQKLNQQMVNDLNLNKKSLEFANIELEIALNKAEESTKAKSEFLANMSHEIRTPMNGIIGATELLKNRVQNPDNLRLIKIINDSSESLLTLINDILDFSKIEAGKMEIVESEFNLLESIESVIDRFIIKAAQKKLELSYFIEDDVPGYVCGDENRVTQVIVNLLGNSMKFTSEGHVHLHVSLVDSNEKASNIRFSIEDTGIGIRQDKIDHIFESFTQEDGTINRNYGGTGLGTTISRLLTRLMGGNLWAISPNPNNKVNSNPGSIFQFVIPFKKSNATKLKQIENSTINFFNGMKTLLVDDNSTNMEILRKYLEKFNMNIDYTHSPIEALKLIDSNDYRLLITDFSMPGLSGIDLIKYLKKIDLKNWTKTIILSSDNMTLGSNDQKENDVDAILYKPIKQSDFYNNLMKVFNINIIEKEVKSSSSDHSFENARDYNLLIVEDNAINQKIAESIFKSLGFSIDIADNGKMGLEFVLEKKYDIIFMDYQMPLMNGIEATQAIRNQKINTPIIALTANALKGDKEIFLEAGMNDYISKPFKVDDIRQVLLKWLPEI